MKRTPSVVMCALAVWLVSTAYAEDARVLVPMPVPAQDALRAEMVGNLLALHEVVSLMAQNKVQEAGQLAEAQLGRSAMGKNARLPPEARPGMHMPPAMHELGKKGHWSATEFAQAAATGDRDRALQLLPQLTGSCVACHAAYRVR